MSLTTISAGSSAATRPDALAEDVELTDATKPTCAPIALSAEAKDRLKLLNRVLANCVPQSLAALIRVPVETKRE